MALHLPSLFFGFVLLGSALAALPAGAQGGSGNGQNPDAGAPPSDLPRPEHGERVYNLNTLFDALKVAPDAQSAKAIEERIWAVWVVSGSDTCNLLMGRARAAADEKDYDLAIKLLNAVVELKPDYIEGWNRRATIYYLKKDYAHSIADIREVLSREPRHFGGCPDSVSSCRRSATTSTRSKPIAGCSPSIRARSTSPRP